MYYTCCYHVTVVSVIVITMMIMIYGCGYDHDLECDYYDDYDDYDYGYI